MQHQATIATAGRPAAQLPAAGEPTGSLVSFERCQFDRDVVALCVRWYLGSRLSLREVVAMMSKRGLSVSHTTLMRWVRRCSSEPEDMHCGWRPKRSWRVDEGCVRIRGKPRHLHRAVDLAGKTVDFWLSDHRDLAAAEAFFGKS